MLDTLIGALKLTSDVTARTGARIRMSQLEEGDADKGDSVVLTRVGGTPNHLLGNKPSFINPSIVQVDAYAQTRERADALSRVVKTALNAHTGGGVDVIRPYLGDQDFYESETKVFRVFMQFEVWESS